jgi:hypothetical protein
MSNNANTPLSPNKNCCVYHRVFEWNVQWHTSQKIHLLAKLPKKVSAGNTHNSICRAHAIVPMP